jgi:hypothetical protein
LAFTINGRHAVVDSGINDLFPADRRFIMRPVICGPAAFLVLGMESPYGTSIDSITDLGDLPRGDKYPMHSTFRSALDGKTADGTKPTRHASLNRN